MPRDTFQTPSGPALTSDYLYFRSVRRSTLFPEYPPWRSITVGLLVIAISLLPRIPLPISVPSRRFDLRVEDLLLTFMLVVWVLNLVLKGGLHTPRLFKIYTWYLLAGACASVVGIMNYGLDPLRAGLYLTKEVEYGLMGLVVANWTRTKRDLVWVQAAFLVAVFANAAWMGVQVLTGNARPLLASAAPSPFTPAPFLEQYGPGLISEAGAFQTGQFFLFALLLGFAYAQSRIRVSARLFYLAVGLIASVSIALSASRGAIVGAVVGVATLVYIRDRNRMRSVLITVTIAAGAAAMLDFTGLTTPGRFTAERIRDGLLDRAQHIWRPMVANDLSGALLGFGKGSLGFLARMPYEYAHNQYLRVLLESGVCGLIAFVVTLGAVMYLSKRTYSSATLPITKCIAGATLAVTLARCVQAAVDDVFMGALPTELWWVFVGLTVAASLLEKRLQSIRLGDTGDGSWAFNTTRGMGSSIRFFEPRNGRPDVSPTAS